MSFFETKYEEEAEISYIPTDSSIVCIKTEDICADIAKDVESKLDPSNYELDRPLPKTKKNVV